MVIIGTKGFVFFLVFLFMRPPHLILGLLIPYSFCSIIEYSLYLNMTS